MPPPGVVETTGGGGGRWNAAREGANDTRTVDDCGGRRCEFRVANTEGSPGRHSKRRVICCGGGC
eukprot:1153349-Prymnesium_polylepis.1